MTIQTNSSRSDFSSVAKSPAVIVDRIHKSFDGRAVLRNLSFQVKQGEFLTILGKSGGGKSTLLKILGGLETQDAGTVLTKSRQTMVFQEPRLIKGRKVWENVTIGLSRGRNRKEEANTILKEVGLEGFAKAWPTSLSGGEAQRVALARALIRSPELMLLDEPFGALDALTRLRIQSLVAKLHERYNPTIMLVTHDVDEAILLSDRIIVLREGEIGAEYAVPFSKGRSRSMPGFAELHANLLVELGIQERIG
ncbi:ABC transporter ATP-binding protein [Corynebacterium glutamicum]|uniref:ABC transporter ATP-binding protein n=1 Tax=Corynebacterium glutamicum TaxID=1718 RepID=UPI00216190CF|nr:ABC transporter ATP-binding protein [Corynebacterium glutamicum]